MKDTPITNGYIKAIKKSIYELSLFIDLHEEPFGCMNPNDFIDDLEIL